MSSLLLHDLFAATFNVNLNLGTILFGLGVLGIIVAFLLGVTSTVGKAAGIIGVLLLLGGFFGGSNGGNPTPAPGPTPYPGPYYPPNPYPTPYPPGPTPGPAPSPTPAPTNFATSIQQAFAASAGTKEEAATLAALFTRFSDDIIYDGRRSQHLITSGNGLGSRFALLQEYHAMQNPTPWGQKFGPLEQVISAEITRMGLKEGTFDDAKRTNASLLFRAVGDALRAIQ